MFDPVALGVDVGHRLIAIYRWCTRPSITICVAELTQIFNEIINPAELWIAGEGPLRRELTSLSEEYGGRVHFLGFVPNNELAERFWARIDCFVFPSLFDGWAMVIPEALAAGVPVLSGPDVGAAREFIHEGHHEPPIRSRRAPVPLVRRQQNTSLDQV